jgi:hypothetical protein
MNWHSKILSANHNASSREGGQRATRIIYRGARAQYPVRTGSGKPPQPTTKGFPHVRPDPASG